MAEAVECVRTALGLLMRLPEAAIAPFGAEGSAAPFPSFGKGAVWETEEVLRFLKNRPDICSGMQIANLDGDN